MMFQSHQLIYPSIHHKKKENRLRKLINSNFTLKKKSILSSSDNAINAQMNQNNKLQHSSLQMTRSKTMQQQQRRTKITTVRGLKVLASTCYILLSSMTLSNEMVQAFVVSPVINMGRTGKGGIESNKESILVSSPLQPGRIKKNRNKRRNERLVVEGLKGQKPLHLYMDDFSFGETTATTTTTAATGIAESLSSSSSSSYSLMNVFGPSSSLLLSFLNDGGAEQSQNVLSTLVEVLEDEEEKLLTPDVEAEVLTDVSHVIMDFSNLLTPSKALHRIYAVIGRILVICADYLPDHMVRPEELAIQMFLLGLSVKEVINMFSTAATTTLASSSSSSNSTKSSRDQCDCEKH